jgi:predicted transcriptional regulator
MRRTQETQLTAYAEIQDSLSEARGKVLRTISKNGGATTFEIAKLLSWPINRVSGRVTELCDKGAAIDSGERRVNPESGKKCIVWALPQDAKAGL